MSRIQIFDLNINSEKLRDLSDEELNLQGGGIGTGLLSDNIHILYLDPSGVIVCGGGGSRFGGLVSSTGSTFPKTIDNW